MVENPRSLISWTFHTFYSIQTGLQWHCDLTFVFVCHSFVCVQSICTDCRCITVWDKQKVHWNWSYCISRSLRFSDFLNPLRFPFIIDVLLLSVLFVRTKVNHCWPKHLWSYCSGWNCKFFKWFSISKAIDQCCPINTLCHASLNEDLTISLWRVCVLTHVSVHSLNKKFF